MTNATRLCLLGSLGLALGASLDDSANRGASPTDTHAVARIDPDVDGAGWEPLFPDDTLAGWRHNCTDETWALADGVLACSGDTNGGLMSDKVYRNFEIAFEWQHQRRSGNAGLFVWVPHLPEKGLPTGIEVQILDLGYAEDWKERNGSAPDWFTCHGDVFPCGESTMKPFAPVAPDGVRSFPTAETTRPYGQWNHYYVRCVNGEVRLWVNGREVSGGTQCTPAEGPIAFEAEGAPILYRNIRIRELP